MARRIERDGPPWVHPGKAEGADHEVVAAALEGVEHLAQSAGLAQRTVRHELDDGAVGFAEMCCRLLHSGDRGGADGRMVIGMDSAQERHLHPRLGRGPGDRRVVGADHDAAEAPRGARGLDRMGDHRPAAKRHDVLAGQALGAATGRDHGQDRMCHHSVQPPSATRLAPVMPAAPSPSRKSTGPTTSFSSIIRPAGQSAA